MDIDNPVPFEGDFFGSAADYRASELPGWGSDDSNVTSASQPQEAASRPSRVEAAALRDLGEDSDDEDELAERIEVLRSTWEPDRRDLDNSALPEGGISSSSPSPDAATRLSPMPNHSSLPALGEPASNGMPPDSALENTISDEPEPESESGRPEGEPASAAEEHQRTRMEEAFRRKIHVRHFPSALAGAPVPPHRPANVVVLPNDVHASDISATSQMPSAPSSTRSTSDAEAGACSTAGAVPRVPESITNTSTREPVILDADHSRRHAAEQPAASSPVYAAYDQDLKKLQAPRQLEGDGASNVGGSDPSSTAANSGQPVNTSANPSCPPPPENITYAPFKSKTEWDLIRWAKLRGPGSTAFDELLAIKGMRDKLGLSFHTTREANAIVDSLPAPRPVFKRDEVVVDNRAFDVYFRDVIECIRSLYGEPEFAQHLVFLPERHYHDPDCTQRLYHDMHTGKWWWAAQKAVEARTPGATIVPVILSSDKTQLTLFRNKAAYPVYLTIGNLPKDVRSKPSRGAQVLLAYLPTTKLEHIRNKSARRRTQSNLFHACMRRILGALEQAGLDGLSMVSGDGVTRRVHPLYAAYVGDYPEQVLVTCTKSGECPVCTQPRDSLGELGEKHPTRALQPVLDVLSRVDDLSRADYGRACKAVGIKPVYKPFWENLPYSDIFLSITPDILHQLLQGVIKHLVSWIKDAYSEDEIDARCRRFPPNHNVRLFFKGITKLSRLTGGEHADICRILLALVIDLRLKDRDAPRGSQERLVRAVRAMLDFVYLAQYPVHSAQSLDALDDALARFHENKDVFIDLGIRSDFDFPKLHFCRHYREFIENLGTADNYNTEYTERLHIDMAKEAYRASNKKDEYDQMTLWLERKEKVLRYDRYIKWRESNPQTSADERNPLYQHHESHILMTREPSAKAVPISRLQSDYGAADFEQCLVKFIAKFNHPDATPRDLKVLESRIYLRFDKVPVYHKAKLWASDFPLYRHASDERDVIHATPARKNKRGDVVPGQFDPVLINLGSGKSVGVGGYRVGQVRAIFTIPRAYQAELFLPEREPPDHLVYIEWFTAFTRPNPVHGLRKVARAVKDGTRTAEVRLLSDIRRSVHLNPCFGAVVPRHWTSANVLDECSSFWVSPFMDRHAYGIIV
ncbi:hypothetical protein PsYK624_172670 [Phanerochaete sordida]|uniref:Uncharacterized protein n=1 Tax=Phanerochaete sordida TaxID=48140 RepID=A0A9P3LPZ2_9APHY|nr:hypothetical protein PsYK624_172670 [Phanerochaete sordida]